MPTILDVFQSPHFSARALTDGVNAVPNRYHRLEQLNVFPIRPVPTTYVTIEYRNGILNLLPTRERGTAGSQGLRGRRDKRTFEIPHIPHDDALMATDLQNRITFGTNDVLTPMMDAMTEKLADMTAKHFITLEHLRVGAIKGQILDADGSLIYDLFQEFGITAKVFAFTFSDPNFDVGAKARELKGYLEDNLQGEVMTSVRALCSQEFFASFVGHPSVQKAYQFYTSAQEPLRNDVRKGFEFKGISWEEYRGSATYLEADNSQTRTRFIDQGTAQFYPEGTQQTFATYIAPPDSVDEANMAPKPGQLIYAKQERMKFDKGIEIHTESNPLPLCKRPALLVKGTSN
ncbi:major capsid protein [Methylobacterium nodulans]|uniref:Phage related protein n=1 Tax=Methylobacterium nodulans (strain LMG 21967 / CNCM I-2342 / ORS 2060) TaxID=460265 RepID=B8IDQ8_METNO|nr:major capsid protein [Methylobacterium nodulans]ACL55630.1 conserved hypothetical protein [Methylobacterium nodulans ORS 2060]